MIVKNTVKGHRARMRENNVENSVVMICKMAFNFAFSLTSVKC
jgi:hypothetical protein